MPPGQPPGWPSGPPTAYGFPGTAGKKPNTGAIVAVVLVAVFVCIAGLVGVAALASDDDIPTAESNYDSGPGPTYNPPTTYSSPTTTETTTSTSESSTTRSSTTERETDETNRTPTGPRPVYALADHPLFASKKYGLQNFECQLPRWVTSPQGAARFFSGAKDCLDHSWGTLLKAMNLPFRSPSLKFPSGTSWSTPCGRFSTANFAAYYCGKNETLYMPFAGLQTEMYGAHPGVYLALFAHEYGHHVQQLTGIMRAYWEARYDVGVDSAQGLELSRRAELQAQCFSGMLLGSLASLQGGSVNQQVYREAWNSQRRGDKPGRPRSHGTNAHAVSWWRHGAKTNRTWQCNTWAADAADVA